MTAHLTMRRKLGEGTSWVWDRRGQVDLSLIWVVRVDNPRKDRSTLALLQRLPRIEPVH